MTHGGSLSLAGVLARLVGVSEEAGGARYRTRTVWQDAGCVFARRVALDPVVKRLAFAQALYVDDVHSIVTKIKVREPCRYASGPRVHAPSRRRTRTPTLLCAQAPACMPRPVGAPLRARCSAHRLLLYWVLPGPLPKLQPASRKQQCYTLTPKTALEYLTAPPLPMAEVASFCVEIPDNLREITKTLDARRAHTELDLLGNLITVLETIDQQTTVSPGGVQKSTDILKRSNIAMLLSALGQVRAQAGLPVCSQQALYPAANARVVSVLVRAYGRRLCACVRACVRAASPCVRARG